MPRPARSLEEGRTYHVYNRVGGSAMPFDEARLASRFVELLREVVKRDSLLVLAWVLMGNHYHLVVRMGATLLSRSMKTLQQEVARTGNRAAGTHGHLWQGRFNAKRVDVERYLGQLIAYVHLNPVAARMVDDPANHRWSGHHEVVGDRNDGIVAVDDLLAMYGRHRCEAVDAYRSALGGFGNADWLCAAPGHLPWWRLGRPPGRRGLHPLRCDMVDELGRPTSPYRSRFEAKAWVEEACGVLGLSREELAGRGQDSRIVRMRELVGVVGVERFGVKVRDLARCLGKSEDGVSRWVRRGARRRIEDMEFANDAEMLDAAFRDER